MKHYLGAGMLAFIALAACVTTEPEIEPVLEELVTEINSSDSLVEYGTFLYCDEESCWYPILVKGEEYSVDLAPAVIEDQLHNLVGSIHSHPFVENNDLLNEVNTTPSDTDWAVNYLFSLKSDKPYTIYIIGPDDIMRSYPLPYKK